MSPYDRESSSPTGGSGSMKKKCRGKLRQNFSAVDLDAQDDTEVLVLQAVQLGAVLVA